jgi:hypothetical protein
VTGNPESDDKKSGNQRLAPPDYSRLFQQDARPTPPGITERAGGFIYRIQAIFAGLFFTVMAMGFVVVGIWTVLTSVRQADTWKPATATVATVQGGDIKSDFVKVHYRYQAQGLPHEGVLSAQDKEKDNFAKFRQYKVGQTLSVYYDPQDPGKSELTVGANATGLGFSIFAMPFLLVGLTALRAGLSSREAVASRRFGPQSISLPGGGMIAVFAIPCAVLGFGQFFLGGVLGWPGGLYSALGILFIILPGILWIAFRIRARRRAKTGSHVGRQSKAPPAPIAVAPAPRLSGLLKKLAFTGCFTLFWCGLVGTFCGFVLHTYWKNQVAAATFTTAPGMVVSSKIDTSSDSESTTVRPAIKYTFVVNDKEYVSNQYSYGDFGSSDARYARTAVNSCPPGKAVTVYYDPANPSDSVLSFEASTATNFMLMFLQPFVAVGLVMIGKTIWVPIGHARLQHFLRADCRPPWRIPQWGVLRPCPGGACIQQRASRVGTALAWGIGGYLLTIFTLTLVGTRFLFETDSLSRNASQYILMPFGIAAAAGMVAAAFKLVLGTRARSQLILDASTNAVRLTTPRRNVQVNFDDIARWQLREVAYPAGMAVNNQRLRYILLEVQTHKNECIPLHAFKPSAGPTSSLPLEVIERIVAGFAVLTGAKANESIVADDSSAASNVQPANPAQAMAAMGKAFSAMLPSKDQYSDLR